jgi:plastocyanin
MRVGQTVAWTNADVITHTATQDQGAFNTGGISAGTASTPITMSTSGTFSYHCSIHPTMVGVLTVNP